MAVEFQDYYKTLGVSREAGPDDIKKAFRKLAREHHPDVAADKTAAEARFKEINEAYEVLSDPEKRAKYDRLGANWQSAGPEPGGWYESPENGNTGEFHFSGTGFSDFFEQFFGAGGQFHRPRGSSAGPAAAMRGRDIEGDILITLAEAMHGTTRPISLQTANPASRQMETRSLQVRIPPGAVDGRRIRVAGQGGPGIGGGPPGDLFLRVRHAAHPDFTTLGHDVYREAGIAPWDAVLGAEIQVGTLDGAIKLKIPPGTESGQKFRLRGRGLPKGKTGERGDLFVTVQVRTPPLESAETRELWEKLRAASQFKPGTPS
jgi:curved DNA-binding protein